MTNFEGEWFEGVPKNHDHHTPIFFNGEEALVAANLARDDLMRRTSHLPAPYDEVPDVVSSWLILAVRSFDYRPIKRGTLFHLPSITPVYLESVLDEYIVRDSNPALYDAFEIAKNDALRTMVGSYLSGRRN